MKSKLLPIAVFFLLTIIGQAQDWKVYPYNPSGQIAFSQDEGRHTTEPIEWWYTSGHVTGQTSGKRYSFMYTVFHYPQSIFDGFRILNITDDTTGEFFQDVKPLNYTTLSTSSFDIEANVFQAGIEYWRNRKDASNSSIPFEYELFTASGTGGLDLTLETLKRPLILGEDGYLEQGQTNYTYYFSQTSNAVNGTLTFNGITESVVGTAWIDRQYGSFNPLTGEKYEWFSIQLSNGVDLNLWTIFNDNREIPNTEQYKILAAYIDESTQYTINDFEIERLAFNCMPDGERCYSKQWRLTSEINNIDLAISTLHDNTEVLLPFRFFEGSIDITGTVDGVTVTGIGFAELLHHYEDPIPEFTSQLDGLYNMDDMISWDLNNPDDGRNVFYDLEYSIDNQQSFTVIVENLIDQNYVWTENPLSNGQDVWFRLTAHSIDNALSSNIVSSALTNMTLSNNDRGFLNALLFPNPVSSELKISFQNIIQKGSFTIYDLSGRIISIGEIDNTAQIIISTVQLNSGLFIIKLRTGTADSVFKFVKE
jgi:predicted secreted hydrolase